MVTDDEIGNGDSILILSVRRTNNDEVFIILGALCTMMSVGTGAFGAHVLEDKLNEKIFCMKSNNISMYHGLGLI